MSIYNGRGALETASRFHHQPQCQQSILPHKVRHSLLQPIASLLFEITMASATNAPSSQVATLYGHTDSRRRWSEFEDIYDEADDLEARMARMAITHRISMKRGFRYACSSFLLASLHICLDVPFCFGPPPPPFFGTWAICLEDHRSIAMNPLLIQQKGHCQVHHQQRFDATSARPCFRSRPRIGPPSNGLDFQTTFSTVGS